MGFGEKDSFSEFNGQKMRRRPVAGVWAVAVQ
jgi:hypothetical protein